MYSTSKAVRALSRILRNPRVLARILDDEETSRAAVLEQYGLTNGLPITPFEHILSDNFRETVRPYAFLEGGSLITDYALLRGLARQLPNCRYFEIGTWRGESVANVADVAADCVTLSLPEDDLRKMGYSEGIIAEHRHYSDRLANVSHLQANSLTFDFSTLGKFDLVFIDGDHRHSSVRSDTANVFRHLIHEGSVVVWHDYGLNPEDVRWEVLRGILNGVPRELHAYLRHVAHTKSAVFARKTLPSRALRHPESPDLDFTIEVSWKSPSSSVKYN